MFETPPPPQLRVKNLVVFKVYCNTFEVTFQCLEISFTSSETKQDETKLDKDNHILAISPSKLIIFGFYEVIKCYSENSIIFLTIPPNGAFFTLYTVFFMSSLSNKGE